MSLKYTETVGEVASQHEMIGVEKKSTPAATNPNAKWFEQAGLGLFLHWGISSVRGDGDLSWAMIEKPRDGWEGRYNLVTPEEYWEQARAFNPQKYDPDKWLRAAREAGMRYAVLTTKHHDGYALWPSAHGALSTRTHMESRDLVGDFVAACRRNDLKVGLYYSPPDWFYHRRHMSFRYGGKSRFPDLPDLGTRHEPVSLPVLSDEEKIERASLFAHYTRGQVEELLTRYGTIDVLWFDGGSDAISIERIRQLQPTILINNRAHGQADFDTKEVGFPKERPQGLWEFCSLWNGGVELPEGSWGYRTHEKHRATSVILSELVKSRAWGGNYLPNLGPNAHGELPHNAYKGLAELARWMQHSGESVVQTQAGGWPEHSNVPETRQGETRFFHLLPGEPGHIQARGVPQPRSVTLLRTGEALEHKWQDDTLRLNVITQIRTTEVDVVAVRPQVLG